VWRGAMAKKGHRLVGAGPKATRSIDTCCGWRIGPHRESLRPHLRGATGPAPRPQPRVTWDTGPRGFRSHKGCRSPEPPFRRTNRVGVRQGAGAFGHGGQTTVWTLVWQWSRPSARLARRRVAPCPVGYIENSFRLEEIIARTRRRGPRQRGGKPNASPTIPPFA